MDAVKLDLDAREESVGGGSQLEDINWNYIWSSNPESRSLAW
jgi:hypothetical protein